MRTTEKGKTESFIRKYLVDGNIGKGYGLYRMVAETSGVDKCQIARTIRKMDYKEYLKTRCWQLIAQQVKHDANWRCSLCGSRHDLVVHHPDYRRVGYEMYHVDELQCLCRKCHDEIHKAS